METCKSPRKVLREAYELASELLPAHASPFSRRDGFTEPQLFACLVLREHQKKSYRAVEALLADSPTWLADIGLTRAPDHNTLCRAFGRLVRRGPMNRMLDRQAARAERRRLVRGRVRPVALDSSMFESRHVSRHFEKRRKQAAAAGAAAAGRQKKTAGTAAGRSRRP
jgi:hypothetical protein